MAMAVDRTLGPGPLQAASLQSQFTPDLWREMVCVKIIIKMEVSEEKNNVQIHLVKYENSDS